MEVELKHCCLSLNLFQYYSDSNDAESWMKEKMYVASSEDYGRDEQSAMVGRDIFSEYVLLVLAHTGDKTT